MNVKSLLLLKSFLLISLLPYAQINVTDGLTGQQLAEILSGSNINVTNVVYTGSGNDPSDTEWAAGSFVSTNGFNFASGIILSTGDVQNSAGPNNDPNTSDNLGYPGTAEMEALGGANSWDVASLEFDFVVQSSHIQFEYIFASEDYPEAAPPNNPDFNDVFAFYISGPGIVGEENIALIPGTSDPVAIQNINPVFNSQYFVDNTGGVEIQEDGHTVPLIAEKDGLIACETYHLRLVISDIHNTNRNSAVYLKENSFVQENVLGVETNTVSANGIALEGCKQGSFTFEYEEISNQDRIISYTIGGSAVNGVDYAYLDTAITIPAGETAGTVFIDAFSDGITEGQETVMLIYPSGACVGFDTAYLYIDDSNPIDFTLDGTDLSCFEDQSGEILVNISGGSAPYTIYYTNENGVESNTSNNPVTGLAAGEYIVQVEDLYGCRADALVIGGLFDADTTFLPDGSGVTYDAPLEIQGFNPGQTIESSDQIQQICLTMEHSYLGDLQITVESPTGQEVILKEFGAGSCDLGEPFASGQVDGQNSDLTDPGVGYEYCFNATPTFLTMVQESNNYTHTIPSSTGGTYTDNYLPAGSYTSFESIDGLVGSEMNGTWTVHVTDQFALDNGYIFNWYISLIGDEPDTIVTLIQPEELIISGSVTNATCGNADGAINISVSGNSGNLSFLWSNNETTEDISNLSAGEYTVTVTDANGCQAIQTFYVNNVGSLALNANITDVNCSGDATGAINVTPSGGTQPYTFVWTNQEITEDISNLTSGDYTVTMTDAANCQTSATFTVEENAPITVVNALVSNEECNTDNGAIDITVAGGSGSYGYSWSNNESTQDLSNLNSGTYTVNIIDGFGCQASSQYSVGNNLSNCSAYCYLDITLNSKTDEFCGGSNGSIDINILNAVPPYSVEWSNNATTEDLTNLSEGEYTVTVIDANNCSETLTISITNETGSFDLLQSSIFAENCGDSDGAIDLTLTGGAQPYSFNWSNNETTEDLNNLSAGLYEVEISDGNGCTITESFNVTNNSAGLSVSGSVTPTGCSSATGSIYQTITGANGNLTYLWSTNATSQNLTSLTSGTYTCTITDQSGCSVTKEYFVGQSTGDLSILGINVTNETCGNGQGAINITTTGNNLTYLWTNNETTEDITGLSAGTYSCQITSAVGCTINTGDINVINSSGTLNVSTQLVIDEICSNNEGSINMNVSGGTQPYNYLWSNNSTDQDINQLAAGIYTLTTTDGNGCQESHSIEVENIQGTLEIANAVKVNETCGDQTGSINLTISGGSAPITFDWSTNDATEDITNLSAGNYSVTVTDNNGCEISDNFTIENDANNLSYAATVTNEVCSNSNGSILLNVSGGNPGYQFNWSTNTSGNVINNLTSGDYWCEITDMDGCTITTEIFTINNTPNGISASTNVSHAICTNDGAIDLVINGGINPTVLWSNNETTEDLSNLSSGEYAYTITDDNGCIVSGSAIVNATNDGLAYTYTTSAETCNNSSGSIDLEVTGGSGSYNYSWSNNATTQDLTNIVSGAYTVEISDNNGCSITSEIIQVNELTGDLIVSDISVVNETCTNASGAINLTVQGGLAPFDILWSNNETTEDISNLTAGTYSVTISDANGCTTSSQAIVGTSSGTLAILQPVVSNETCSLGNGSINITVQGNLNPTTYEWSNNMTTEDISNLSAGTYTVLITDANGCTINESYTVTNTGSDLEITSASLTNDVCNSGTGSIDIEVTGGLAPYAYAWNTNEHASSISGLSAGEYTVTVTGQGGCVVYGNYIITNDAGDLTVTGVVNNEICGQNNGSIDITTTGGNGNLSFIWSNNETSEDLQNLTEGVYTLVVSDIYGCSSNFVGTVINEANGISITIDNISNENCGLADGAIETTVTGSNVSILWSNNEVTDDITNLSAGSYTITVQDDQGCSAQESVNLNNVTSGLSIDFTNIQNENCSNGQGFIDIEVSGNAPLTYLWSNNEVTQDISGLSAGTYTVTVTDGNNCMLSESYTVGNTNNSNLSINGNISNALCTSSNGEIDVTVSGGIQPWQFSWSNNANSEDLMNLQPGNYTLTVTDDVGCSLNETFTIESEHSGVDFETININPEFCGQSDGQIFMFPPSGTAATFYVDGVMQFTNTYNNASSGDYLLTIEDQYGCTNDSIVTVTGQAFFNVFETITDETCSASNGSIELQVFGGGGPGGGNFTYSWAHGPTSQNIYNLEAGEYTVTITEGFCSNDYTFTVENQIGFDVTATINDDYCGTNSGSIDQQITGGTNMSYVWSTNETTEDVTNIPSGTYTCTVSELGGCTIDFEYVINNNSNGTIINAIVINELCGNGTGSIDATVTGGSGNYAYAWDNLETTEDLTGLSSGNYTLSVTDLTDNCIISESFQVNSNPIAFNITSNVTAATCGNCADGQIDLVPPVGSSYTYQWTPGNESTEDITGLNPGQYTCIATSPEGCDTTMIFTVGNSVGLTEQLPNIIFSAYPNPADESFTVNYKLQSNDDGQLIIMDMMGKTVNELLITGEGSNTFTTFDMSDGVYFITLKLKNESLTKRIIIRK